MEEIQASITAATEIGKTVNSGVGNIMNYDNIAIVVLMVSVCFSGIFNIIQARVLFWVLMKFNKTMAGLDKNVAILNERIGH